MQRNFTCCVGTGMESHALHGLGIYYQSAGRLWINLYASSQANWQNAGVKLRMESTFPEAASHDDVTLQLETSRPKELTLSLRRPSWAGEGFAIRVNGEPVSHRSPAGSYIDVRREWKTGDVLTIALPKQLRLRRLADNPTRAAVIWGPLVLAADLGPQPRQAADGDGEGPPVATVESPVIVTDRPVTEWVKPVAGASGSFATSNVGIDLTLAPFYRTHRRVYTGYLDVLTPAENTSRREEEAAERDRIRRIEIATIAYVAPSDGSIERAHNQQGEETSIVRVGGRPGRRAARWFSYDLPIAGTTARALVVTYNRDNRRARSFKVLVDGEQLAEESFPFDSEPRFFDREYALPPSLVQDKSRVTIRFEATGANETAPIFGVRVIR
jgi:hypothetical protein